MGIEHFKIKKILGIMVLGLLLSGNAFAGMEGSGNITLSNSVVNGYLKYLNLNSKHNKSKGAGARGIGTSFAVSVSGSEYGYSYCQRGQNCRGGPFVAIDSCKKRTTEKCYTFSRKRKIVWNGLNINLSKTLLDSEIRAKLTELGFLGDNTSSTTTTTPKITKKKKETKKVVKKYELKGERSIALSWEGYEDLIAGTVNFDETDYKGTLNLPLPNNDGTCSGTYSLQEDEKGTWQIACSNNMSASGNLKWVKDGGVTGTGTDHNNKKVKFTVSKNN